jgi:DNA-binding CsgD family transcriptional regulator
MPSRITTYEKYLEIVSGSSGMDITKEQSGIIIDRFRSANDGPSFFTPATYILDYTSRKYIFVDEAVYNLLGYKAVYFRESGLEYYTSKLHPSDFEILNSKIFPVNLDFIREVPASQYPEYVFSYNHRALNAKGDYVHVVQRHSYIPDAYTGQPAGVIGVVFDFTHFKTDSSITHTIEKTIYCNGALANELILKKNYSTLDPDLRSGLSERELEIVRFMADGFNSKQIADHLNISLNTVNNHRKNMLKKMDCTTPTQLLKKIIGEGML